MEKLIYNIFNKIFMNEVEKELLNYFGEEILSEYLQSLLKKNSSNNYFD